MPPEASKYILIKISLNCNFRFAFYFTFYYNSTMGLRVNLNTGVMPFIRQLAATQRQTLNILERIATGIRVTRPSVSPAAFMIGETLRSQMGTVTQAIENTQNAMNLLRTAEGGMSQITNQLQRLNQLAVQAGGTLTPEQQQAVQGAADQIVAAINRIASTTRFGGLNLLGGQLAFQISQQSPELENINVISGTFEGGFPRTIEINVTAAAQRAQVTGQIAETQSADVTIEIAGPQGTVQLNIQAGATRAEVVALINQYTAQTGVEATEEGYIRSTDVGSSQFVRVINVSGELEGITTGMYYGTDIQATVEGVPAVGRGNVLTVQTPALSAQITVEAGQTGTFQFTIAGGGAGFQLGPGTLPSERIYLGLPNLGASMIGRTSGLAALQAITTGGTYQLTTNPQAAQQIIQSAISEVAMARGTLGAFERYTLGAQRSNLETAFENIAAARSRFIEANIPEEITNMMRMRILRAFNIQALRQSMNLTPASIMQLLG
jgi:flagellin